MRRRSTQKDRTWRAYDIRKDIKESRLAALGACIIAWNDIEGAIDTAFGMSLDLNFPMWIQVSSRINGLDGKFEIIKQAIKLEFGLPAVLQKQIFETLDSVAHYKKFRDGVMHARITDPDDPVARTAQRKGIEDEVLISEDALNALYSHLAALRLEVDCMVLIVHYVQIADRREREGRAREKQQAVRGFLIETAQLPEHQKHRRSLPPLPKFPQERPIPQATATPEASPA